jgi:phenylalanyl-tRNA synthetase beta subunit
MTADPQAVAQTDLITYFVNGEREQTREHKRTVRAILLDAGFTPVENYQLERDEGHHLFPTYDEEVPIHQDERFTALYTGPTPTS